MSDIVVRYQPPDEAVRWLQHGAKTFRREAEEQGNRIVRREGQRTIGKDISDVAGAVLRVGKSALAELAQRQGTSHEYLLHEDFIEIARPTGAKRIEYAEITGVKQAGDKYTLLLRKGSFAITPFAHLVAGRLRIPIGWNRNGMEVPFDTLALEIAARASVDIEAA